jgi:hypothetical protein
MKRSLLLLPLMAISFSTAFAQFTPNNVVLLRTGDGTSSTNVATAIKVSLVEYTKAGVAAGTALDIPSTTASNRLVLSGNTGSGATYEGALRLSSNGLYLCFGGYDVALGASNSAGTTTPSVTNTDKVIARVDIAKNVDLTTKVAMIGSTSMRSVVSSDGTGFWVTNANAEPGLFYVPFGNPITTAYTKVVGTSFRSAQILDGQLYATGGGLITIGSGLPTTLSTVATSNPNPFVSGTNPYGFVIFDVNSAEAGPDLVYLSDQTASTTRGLLKFSKVGGVWVANGTVDISAVAGTVSNGGFLTDMTGMLDAQNKPVIYAVRGTGNNNSFLSINDAAGYNVTISPTIATLASAGANLSFKGISFTPGSNILTTLPLDLISFNAKNENGGVLLSWLTDNEYNVQSFNIERSNNGDLFEIIGTVPAKNIKGRMNYSFIDKSMSSGIAYYRLKIIDNDGTIKYSKINAVKGLSDDDNESLVIYPNPVTAELVMKHPKASIGATISIIALNGKVMITKKVPTENKETKLNLSSLSVGTYIVKYSDGSTLLTKTFLKR